MDYDYLKVSDGSGDAALMHITANRSVGSSTLVVDTVQGVPVKGIATSGTLLSTGLLDPSTLCNFKFHVDSGNLQIDNYEPGSSDTGHIAQQVVIIKPTSGWSNRVANFIQNLTGFGTPQPLTLAALTATAINAVSLILTNNLTVGGSLSVTGNARITGTSAVTPSSTATSDTNGNITPSSQYSEFIGIDKASTIQTPNFGPIGGMGGLLRLRDNGSSQGLSWPAGWAAIGLTLPTSTTPNQNIFVSYVYIAEGAYCVLGIARQG